MRSPRRRNALALCALLALVTASAVISIWARAHAQTAQHNHHCFWKISSPTTALYLLGSIHVLEQDWAQSDELSLRYFHRAQKVVFEFNLEPTSQDDIQAILRSKMINTDKSIQDVISEETFEVLQKTMTAMHLDLDKFRRLKPWALGSLLRQTQLKNIGLDATQGIDMIFLKKAKDDGKEIIVLETLEERLKMLSSAVSFLDAMSKELQEKHLLDILDHLNDYKRLYNNIVTAWMTCDMPVLRQLISAIDPEGYDIVFRSRNRHWLSRLEAFLQNDATYFVVVGLGHMIGPDNVTQLLEERGYTVEQL